MQKNEGSNGLQRRCRYSTLECELLQISFHRYILTLSHSTSNLEKIDKIKNAEAESEAMYLSGIGIANERKALADGIKTTVYGYVNDDNDKICQKNVMDLLLLTQYYDTINVVSNDSNSKASNIILQHDANVTEFTKHFTLT